MVTVIEPNLLHIEPAANDANCFGAMQSNELIEPVAIVDRTVDFLHFRNLLLWQYYPSNFYLEMIYHSDDSSEPN